ncbi:hypothetical protein UB46_12830 [Burkholderiaceae bacterium 16]|nr:hypothetical protein UB46_12830 [Burkholderiaceae bacterium 16]
MTPFRRQFFSRLAGTVAGAGAALASSVGIGGGAIARTAQDGRAEERVVSVKDFAGLDATGSSPSDQAFSRALKEVASLKRKALGDENSNRIGNKRIVLPPGTYLITQPGALVDSGVFGERTQGLTIEGDGAPGTVVIIYQPAMPGPLIKNNDKLLVLRFRNIQFHGKAPNSDLIDSTSTGGAQDYAFDDCIFTGNWRYGANLTGGNNNSEWHFGRCSWAGKWQSFLYVGTANTSDQFLNYWFDHCKYWSSSTWIDMAKGGNIKLTDCDVSGYEPAAQTYLFNLRGRSHARGVCSFKASGLRVEQKTRFAGLMYCEWEQGNIGFKDCDFSSQAYQPFAAGVMSALFSPGDSSGAQVVFDNCQIMGRHHYTTGQAPAGQGRSSYRNCDFLNYTYPDEAFVFSESGGQAGRRRAVVLESCRGNGTGSVYADAEVGWDVAAIATVKQKIVSFKSAFGNLPSGADGPLSVVLPLHAIILRVIVDVPAGALGSGGKAGYTVQTGEASTTALAALNLSPASTGGRVDNQPYFRCSTRQKCTISLVPTVKDQPPGIGALVLVEYIG